MAAKLKDVVAELSKQHREAVVAGLKEQATAIQADLLKALKDERATRKSETEVSDSDAGAVVDTLRKRFAFNGSFESLDRALTVRGLCKYDRRDGRLFGETSEGQVLADLKNAHNDLAFLRGMYDQGCPLTRGGRVVPLHETEVFKRFTGMVKIKDTELGKAIDSVTSGSGSDWVPTEFTPELIQIYDLERQVWGLFRNWNIPRRLYSVPKKTSHSTARVPGQNTAATESSPGTSSITFNLISAKAYIRVSEESEEDSIVPIISAMTEEILIAIARQTEQMLISGDDAATHMDSDTTVSTDIRKQRDGLRRFARDKSNETNGANVAITSKANLDSTIRSGRGTMGKYGVRTARGEVALIIGPKTHNQLVQIPPGDIWTRERYGQLGVPEATVLPAEAMRVDGMPVIVSEFIREDLNVSGAYDATTTDRTIAILVARSEFFTAQAGGPRMASQREVTLGATDLVGTHRIDFKEARDSTEDTVVVVRNLATS